MRGTTGVILQHHRILRLPRKMTVMTDPRHIWNVIYNARNNRWHPPTSPNTAPATQIDSWNFHKNFSKTAETSFTMRDRSENDPTMIRAWSENETVTPQPASQARLLFALATSIFYWKIQHFALQLSFHISRNAAPATKKSTWTSPNTAPAMENDSHDWSSSHMKRHLQCAEQQRCFCNVTKYCACHGKWLSWLILVTYETSFTMRGATEVFLQHHRILRLPHKMTLMIDPHDTWNVIYNARSNRGVSPTSPNTAPATQNDSHDWSAWHMKRYLQCAEQQVSSSNITEYCTCHEKWLSNISQKFLQNSWNVIYNAGPIREWSEQDPTTKPSVRNPPRNRGYFSRSPRAFLYWKIQHFALQLSFHISRNAAPATKMTLELHQILRLPLKMTLMIDPRHIWNVTYNTRSNRGVSPTSPNIAPATENDSHDRSSSHMKRHLQCAEQQRCFSNITEYCACHTKWLSWLIRMTHETSFTMRGATEVFLEHHPILRLPHKMTLMIDPHDMWNVIYNARSNRYHPPTSPKTAPATKNDSLTFHRNFSKTAETSFTMRDRSENDPSRIRPQNRQSATRLATEVTFRAHHEHFLLKNTTFFALRLSFQISRNAAPATKSDTWTSPNTAPATKSGTWTSPKTAPATKSDTWTSPNSAPDTKSDTSLLYSTLLFSTIRYSTLLFSRLYSLLFSYESILRPIYSQTNLISCETIVRRIQSLAKLLPDESIPLRIYSLTNLISYESILRRI